MLWQLDTGAFLILWIILTGESIFDILESDIDSHLIMGGIMSLKTFEKLSADKQEKILSAGIREFSLKSFRDASTDTITKQCQISKGILFHYFESKKKFYLYCLEKSMERLTGRTEEVTGNDFYEILFAEMNRKIRLCMEYRIEMHLVNMSSRDASSEIAKEKAEIMYRYAAVIRSESDKMLRNAMNALHLKNREDTTAEGLHIYINAVMNRYLHQYQQDPDQFFENSETIQSEMNDYLDLILYGICEEESDHERTGIFMAMKLCRDYAKMDASQRQSLQTKRLQEIVRYVRENSPYYQKLYQDLMSKDEISVMDGSKCIL